jgi:hypothetical protein
MSLDRPDLAAARLHAQLSEASAHALPAQLAIADQMGEWPSTLGRGIEAAIPPS